jgi:prepilin-type processing-associated H-X9-DG protein
MRPDRWKAPNGASILERHLGGANYLYADTHARYHKMPQSWKNTSISWKTPDTAQNQPCPQWFPWLDTSDEKW